MMEIDNNVPMPKRYKYPLQDMKVGDSFFVDTNNSYQGIYSSARHVGVRVAIRKAQVNGTKGFRVWRIE